MSSLALGLLLGLGNFMYSSGLAYIPVSTSSLLFSTQLAFTAVFAFVIVRQKFSFYSVNCVVLMMLGASVLAVHTSRDRPPGVDRGQYLLGFFFTLGGAMLSGVSFPMIELSYRKAEKVVTSSVLIQFQVIFSFSATVFCLIGMAINKDFQVNTSNQGRYNEGLNTDFIGGREMPHWALFNNIKQEKSSSNRRTDFIQTNVGLN